MGGTRAAAWQPSFREYVAAAWPIIEPATPFVPGWHFDAICEHLEAVTAGQIRDLLINMPPRHGKSLTVSVLWPTWEWIRTPSTRWLFSSYALNLSIRDSVKCRRLIESPWYQAHWGSVFQLTSDQNAKMRFDNDRMGYRLATSVEGMTTGEGGDRIVVDDPHNVKEAPSDTKREAVLEWWDQAMTTRLNNPKTGTRVIVMQRVHEQDLSGHVLSKGGWEHLCLPAEYEGDDHVTSIGWSDPRRQEGDLLWPAQFGPPELAFLKRELGSYGTAGQLQQRPVPAGGGIFKRDWWRTYRDDPHELAAECDEVVQSWDMAFKDLKSSDYVCGQVWGRKGANKYLLDQIHDKLDFPATLDAVRELTTRWPEARAKYVEDKANGPAVIAMLHDEVDGLIGVEPEGGKVSRANAVTPTIESGNVYLPHSDQSPWIENFLLECSRFPNSKHDDQVDAMSQALVKLAHSWAWA